MANIMKTPIKNVSGSKDSAYGPKDVKVPMGGNISVPLGKPMPQVPAKKK